MISLFPMTCMICRRIHMILKLLMLIETPLRSICLPTPALEPPLNFISIASVPLAILVIWHAIESLPIRAFLVTAWQRPSIILLLLAQSLPKLASRHRARFGTTTSKEERGCNVVTWGIHKRGGVIRNDCCTLGMHDIELLEVVLGQKGVAILGVLGQVVRRLLTG